jgi:hypothetical protein
MNDNPGYFDCLGLARAVARILRRGFYAIRMFGRFHPSVLSAFPTKLGDGFSHYK